MSKLKIILSLIICVSCGLSVSAQTALPDSLLKAKMDSLHNKMRVPPTGSVPVQAVLPVDTVKTIIEEPDTVDAIISKLDTVAVAQEIVDQVDTTSLEPVQVPTEPIINKVLSAAELAAKGDSLRMAYLFRESIREYNNAMAAAKDSLERELYEDKLVLSQNGLSMMSYCSQPVVVAKQKFSLKDFFLFYPLKNRSWRDIPNQLDSLGKSDFVRSMYIPADEDVLYYSAKDEDGIRNIYSTQNIGENWTVPSLINEQMMSSSDEIFPMLSPDGKSLYFASEGLYGMGGYDLYVSTWNRETKDWDTPVNMGFPYSSPYDDFLFINTDDGKYSIFASNRECSRDSVYLYVLEYDSMPVRKSLSDVNTLRTLASLSPDVDPSRIDNASAVSEKMPDNADTKRYMEKMTQVRNLRDSISVFSKRLDEDRVRISTLEGDEKEELSNDILRREMSLPSLKDSLSKATKALQQIEMEFLTSGVVIDPSKLQAESEKEVVGAASGYTFTKNEMGPALNLTIAKPKKEFDYTFMILPEGRFAENNTLPSGLVYQIQILTTTQKATIRELKGLSPVFEKLSPSLRYTYSVGVFKTYADVLSNLNKVKKLGFKTAIITAFNDGKQMDVNLARKMENQVKTLYTVKIYPEDGQNLPDLAKTVIRQNSDKDLARATENGAVVFMAGPFDDKQAAEELVTALRATGVSNTKIESSISE